MSKIDVCIVTYNSEAEIVGCVNSISRELCNIFILDNGSADTTLKILDSLKCELKINDYYVDNTNSGLAAGNNMLAKIGTAEFILMLNPDTLLMADTLEYLLNELIHDKSIGAINPLEIDEYGIKRVSSHRFWNFLQPLIWRCLPYRIPRNIWDKCSRFSGCDVSVATGACLIIRRSVFEAVGGYDPKFFLTISDVADLCDRVRKSGYRVLFSPGCSYLHYGGRSNATEKYITVVNGYYGDLYYFKKRGLKIQFHILMSFMKLSLLIRYHFLKIFSKERAGIYKKTLDVISKAKFESSEPHPHLL